ncbi:uncharacterized protein LOC124886707 [Capsicum annuum]|uniref:uncharacterized protein LOC124886707 n=1 Tax=Capsicum annuum TaxID=4072 RepID=UPI001FB09547|nr:uncharacterized protein LOC124886707 [Capsicum annuum]
MVMSYVTTTKFSTKVNGVGHGFFEGRRGLRQGDPMSPLLFVLVMEYLSRTLMKMSELPDFRFHPMCKRTKFIHLLFADDLMIFCKGTVSSVSRVIEALDHFSKVTGLEANSDKSKVLKEVDKRCREYLWGSSNEKKKISLVAWNTTCLPRKYGGLNIKGCKNWNIASVGKLRVKWVHEVYMTNDADIWAHKPALTSSWYWRKLNSIKVQMLGWYYRGQYILTHTGDYLVNRSYKALNKLLTKTRLQRLNILVEDTKCCLCDDDVEETQEHLFGECQWIMEVSTTLLNWLGIHVRKRDVKTTVQWINTRNWQWFKKHIVARMWGALIYHTWQVRNKKIFQHITTPTSIVISQIQHELRERMNILKESKRAQKCQNWCDRLCT